MSSDKRSVSTDALETLGTIIDATQKRDAIHLAVIPMVATVKLFPGQDVGLVEGGAGPSSDPRGIVDPFLKAPVQAGERFWLVIYPRQITSLRHVWTHPAFPEEGLAFHAEADEHYVDTKAASEAWLRNFVASADCPSYDRLIAAAIGKPLASVNENYYGRDHNDDGEYLHFSGSDAHGEIPDEFWTHVEIVTGVKPPHRAKYFSCSC